MRCIRAKIEKHHFVLAFRENDKIRPYGESTPDQCCSEQRPDILMTNHPDAGSLQPDMHHDADDNAACEIARLENFTR